MAQEIWQAHYRVLSINFLKEFIELNKNLDKIIKNVKLVEFNISIWDCFLEYTTF